MRPRRRLLKNWSGRRVAGARAADPVRSDPWEGCGPPWRVAPQVGLQGNPALRTLSWRSALTGDRRYGGYFLGPSPPIRLESIVDANDARAEFLDQVERDLQAATAAADACFSKLNALRFALRTEPSDLETHREEYREILRQYSRYLPGP